MGPAGQGGRGSFVLFWFDLSEICKICVKSRLNDLKLDQQSSSESTTFHKFYSTEYEIELLLQTKFEFIKRQQSSSLTKNER